MNRIWGTVYVASFIVWILISRPTSTMKRRYIYICQKICVSSKKETCKWDVCLRKETYGWDVSTHGLFHRLDTDSSSYLDYEETVYIYIYVKRNACLRKKRPTNEMCVFEKRPINEMGVHAASFIDCILISRPTSTMKRRYICIYVKRNACLQKKRPVN